ncbi:MAG TPA: tetratricopeptide repeat protein [Clostridiales bacterium]|nr:tetratricopeptide repeat protein [Clostridiales bacterium]
MLQGFLKNNKKKVIIILIISIILMVGASVGNSYRINKLYNKQTVMAKEYLKSGNYSQAIEYYERALTMKNSDKKSLSIGLAEAYIGNNEYDKALEILRGHYEIESGNVIKEMIEEVTLKKADYEYERAISSGDVYFSNEEYDKAILEYENAKKIKSKEVTAYNKIGLSYVNMKSYDLAKEELLEGLTITNNEELMDALKIVETYIVEQKHESIITKAKEFVYQENYEDAISLFKEGISLLPKDAEGYVGLAEIYIDQKKYDEAINLLKGAKKLTYNEEIRRILEKALELKEEEEKMKEALEELYNTLESEKSRQFQLP